MASFDRGDTSEKVIGIVAEKLSVDRNTINSEKTTLQDLGADSLSTFETASKLYS